MLTREMTLGEEIINLTKNGVDISTVERMYRKYIAITTTEADTKNETEEHYRVFKNTLINACSYLACSCSHEDEAIFGEKYSILPNNIAIGDQIQFPLDDLGIFTATAQKIKDNKILFLFDDCVTKRPMNENKNNEGGYEKSDLKKWIDNDLFKMFPKELRKHITGLTIPTLGEICGWEDDWDKENIEPDGEAQLPLMKQRRNRITCYKDESLNGWLRNATKKKFSTANFAAVNGLGSTNCGHASYFYGVRPEFWLVR